jgi:hypothetical protein
VYSTSRSSSSCVSGLVDSRGQTLKDAAESLVDAAATVGSVMAESG